MGRSPCIRRAALAVAAIGSLAVECELFAAPVPAPGYAGRLQIAPAVPVGSLQVPSQMAWGPDGRLYVARAESEIVSYGWNPLTKSLSDRRGTGVAGMGVAFATHAVPGSATPRSYMYVSHRVSGFDGTLSRYADTNGNFAWGELAAGETNVDIVRGVPLGDHSMNHVQIAGNTLYVGIGARTINGRSGSNTAGNFHDEPAGPVSGGGIFGGGKGFTYGETSYNGAIGWIQNLALVANTTSAAQLRDGPNGTSGNLLAGRDTFLPGAPHATKPLTSTAPDKLVVHSAGTRNPFGLAIDRTGAPWFTNNHGRADTKGDGTSEPHFNDRLDSDLANDVGDQFFKARLDGDYRYDNTNFRGHPDFPTQTVVSNTFDNLDSDRPGYNTLHDPANPNGLGPSSSANGFDFMTMDLRGILSGGRREYAVISRWSDFVAEESPGTDVLEFRDVVIVDPSTGAVSRALSGFTNPIDVLSDRAGGFLVADYGMGPGSIYHVTVRGLGPTRDAIGPTFVPEPTSVAGAFAALAMLARSRGRSQRCLLNPVD